LAFDEFAAMKHCVLHLTYTSMAQCRVAAACGYQRGLPSSFSKCCCFRSTDCDKTPACPFS
jgi:hypothetical protein